eukprot:gene31497-6685_t
MPGAIEYHAVPLPETIAHEFTDLQNEVGVSIKRWLKCHGKAVRPKLTESQKQELQHCFKLMDGDGSGAIDAEELASAIYPDGDIVQEKETAGRSAVR